MSKITLFFIIAGAIFGVSVLGFNIWGILGGLWVGIGAKVLLAKLFKK